MRQSFTSTVNHDYDGEYPFKEDGLPYIIACGVTVLPVSLMSEGTLRRGWKLDLCFEKHKEVVTRT